jgi:glycosyltransferase involved in cell wall biosynthesis
MRICRVMRTYPRRGRPGAGLPGWELTRRITEPTLYITRAEPGIPLPVPRHAVLHEVHAWDPVVLSSSASLVGPAAGLKVASYATFFAGGVRRMLRWRPDVVHAHSLPGLLYGAIGARLLRVPWAFTFHGTELRRAVRGPMRRLISRADVIFYVSEHMRPLLEESFPGQQLVYTPSGVDMETFQPGEAVRDKLIVCVARFNWQKGHEYLAAALPAVLGAHAEHRLVAVGSGPGEAEFRRSVERAGLGDRVEILPVLEREQLAAFVRRAAALVIPSVTEGFPKVLVEAMASGTPIVTTDVGCCAEVAGDAAVVVPPRDSAALAKALIDVLSDHDRRTRMSAVGVRRAAEYGWDTTAARVADVFRALLGQRAAA